MRVVPVDGVAHLELLQRRPRQQQALLANVAEADHHLGAVAGADDVEHDALAERLVPHVVADLEPESFGTAGADRPSGTLATPTQRGRDDRFAVGADPAPAFDAER